MQATELAGLAIPSENLVRLKNESFLGRLNIHKPAFVVKGVYWHEERPLIDKNPLAVELAPVNRYKATLAAVLQRRLSKTINKADFELYQTLAKDVQDIADNLGFNSKNPDIDVTAFIECCLDKVGIPEAEPKTEEPKNKLLRLTQQHFDRIDPVKHPVTAERFQEDFGKRKKGAWHRERQRIYSSERALRELVTTNSRITSLLIYDLEHLLQRPLDASELKDARKFAKGLITLANHCQLYSDNPDINILGFIQAVRYKAEYTTPELLKAKRQVTDTLSSSTYVAPRQESRIPWKILPVPIALGILGIIGHLYGLPIFAAQPKPPPAEPTPHTAPLPKNYPPYSADAPPRLPFPKSTEDGTLPPPPKAQPSPVSKSSAPKEKDDTIDSVRTREKPTPVWIFNPAYQFIKKTNEGKEIPPNRQNTLAIALAMKGSENYPSAIVPGKTEWHTDVNALLFVTADPKDKKVKLDFVTPFTRDQLSTHTINGGSPKVKLVASLIGKDAYKKEMSAVAGQPVELALLDKESFVSTMNYLFPQGVKVNIPVAFDGFKAGEQRLKGDGLYYYLAERIAFSLEQGYPSTNGKEVKADFARLQKGLDVVKEIIKNFKDDPPALLRLKDALKKLDLDPKLKKSIDEFDLFGSGIGAIIGYLSDPNLDGAVQIRFHSTQDLADKHGIFYAWQSQYTHDNYYDIASPDPLSAGAEKHFKPIATAIDQIIAGK